MHTCSTWRCSVGSEKGKQRRRRYLSIDTSMAELEAPILDLLDFLPRPFAQTTSLTVSRERSRTPTRITHRLPQRLLQDASYEGRLDRAAPASMADGRRRRELMRKDRSRRYHGRLGKTKQTITRLEMGMSLRVKHGEVKLRVRV